jgi:hypothetical protein
MPYASIDAEAGIIHFKKRWTWTMDSNQHLGDTASSEQSCLSKGLSIALELAQEQIATS